MPQLKRGVKLAEGATQSKRKELEDRTLQTCQPKCLLPRWITYLQTVTASPRQTSPRRSMDEARQTPRVSNVSVHEPLLTVPTFSTVLFCGSLFQITCSLRLLTAHKCYRHPSRHMHCCNPHHNDREIPSASQVEERSEAGQRRVLWDEHSWVQRWCDHRSLRFNRPR